MKKPAFFWGKQNYWETMFYLGVFISLMISAGWIVWKLFF